MTDPNDLKGEASDKVQSKDGSNFDLLEEANEEVQLHGQVTAIVEQFFGPGDTYEGVWEQLEEEAKQLGAELVNVANILADDADPDDDDAEVVGISFQHHFKPNLIVNGARTAMSHLLGEYPSSNNWQITVFKLGTMGNVPGDILAPIPPAVTDTGLVDPLPFVKRYDQVGVCSVNPDVNYNQALCTLASGTWTPNPTVVEYLPPGTETSVQFKMIIERAEANGLGVVAYTEAGLFCQNGTMFARETFPVLAKTPLRRITFLWSILF